MNKRKLTLLAIGIVILLVLSVATAYLLVNTNKNSSVTRVACVGDSLTQSTAYTYELWEMLGRSARYTVGNYTIEPDINATGSSMRYEVGNFGAGSTTISLNTETPYMNTTVFKDALEFQPDIVIIMLGTNDAQPNLAANNATLTDDYVKLVDAFKGLSSKPKIWVVLPPPIFSNQSGKMNPEYYKLTVIPSIEQAADRTNSATIDVYSALASHPEYFTDGVHPNSSAAEIIANEVYKAIIPQNTP